MTGGVVRRDTLREAVTALIEPGVDPSGEPLPEWVHVSEIRRVLDAVPDVPPDPPTATRDELARVLRATFARVVEPAYYWRNKADALIASGVLVDATEVKAQALEDAADALPSLTEGGGREGTATWGREERDVYSLAIEEAQGALRDRAVSERERTI